MWRPGDAKPQANGKRKAPGRNNSSSRNSDGNKNGESSKACEIGTMEGPASGPSASAATPQKKLSGALMNMKFMKRQNVQRQQHGQVKQPSTTSPLHKSSPDSRINAAQNDDDPMDLEMESHSPLVGNASAMTVMTEAAAGDGLVDVTPATSADMYGIPGCVIGRRSFGGFNRPIEDTWKASYRALKEGGDRKRDQVSDEELLQRYATLVKHNRKSNDEDSSRRPVGNLGDKVKPRQKMGSGEKRKR
jgi:M-phase phosphoprotein 6